MDHLTDDIVLLGTCQFHNRGSRTCTYRLRSHIRVTVSTNHSSTPHCNGEGDHQLASHQAAALDQNVPVWPRNGGERNGSRSRDNVKGAHHRGSDALYLSRSSYFSGMLKSKAPLCEDRFSAGAVLVFGLDPLFISGLDNYNIAKSP
jgi:hypothetical protein